MVSLHRLEKRAISSARTTTSTSKTNRAIGTPTVVVAVAVPKSSTIRNNPGSTHLAVASTTLRTAAGTTTTTATATSDVSDLAESTAAQPPAIGTSMIIGIGIGILLILGIIGIFVRRKILAKKFDTSDDKEWIADNQPRSRSISSKEDHGDHGSLSDSARPLSVTSQLNHVYHVPSETAMTQTQNNGISNNMNPYPFSPIPRNQPDVRPDYIVSNPIQPISSNLYNNSDNYQSSVQSNNPSMAQPDHIDYVVSKPAQPITNNLLINNNSDNSQSSVEGNDPFMDSDTSDVDNGINNEIDNGIDNGIDNEIDNEIDNGIDDGTNDFMPAIDVDDPFLTVPLKENEIPPQIPPLTLSGSKKNLIKPANDHDVSSKVFDQNQAYLELSRPTSHPLDDLETIFAQFNYDNKSDDLAQSITISTAPESVKVAEPFTFSTASSTPNTGTVVAQSPDQSSRVASSVTIDLNSENLKQTSSGLSNQSDDSKKIFVHSALKQDESSQLAQPATIAEFVNAKSVTTTTDIVEKSETAAKKSKTLFLEQTDRQKENDILLVPTSPVPSISVTSDDSETEEVILMATLEYGLENNFDDTASTPEEITEPLASTSVVERTNESSIFVDSKSEQESTIDSSEVSPSTTSVADNRLSTDSKLYRSPTLSVFSLYDQETTEQQTIYRPPIQINGSHVKSVVDMFDTGRIVDAKKASKNNSGS